MRNKASSHAPPLPRCSQVNGRKLVPSPGVLLRFSLPMLLWAAGIVALFGASLLRLAALQAPLASLNAAAHVTYRMSRVRLMVGPGHAGMMQGLLLQHCNALLGTLP